MRTSPAPTTSVTIAVEDAGHTSMLRSMLTTLTSQHGTQQSRFVARTTDISEAPSVVATSSPFPVVPLGLMEGPFAMMEGQDAAPDGGWPDEARAALEELDAMLFADGWECIATGPRWWDRRYARAAG